MKEILIKIINLYQKMPGNFHYSCKFYPTCSEYAKESLENYGLLKGGIFALWRILRCNPFSKGGYDPVLKKNDNKRKNV